MLGTTVMVENVMEIKGQCTKPKLMAIDDDNYSVQFILFFLYKLLYNKDFYPQSGYMINSLITKTLYIMYSVDYQLMFHYVEQWSKYRYLNLLHYDSLVSHPVTEMYLEQLAWLILFLLLHHHH